MNESPEGPNTFTASRAKKRGRLSPLTTVLLVSGFFFVVFILLSGIVFFKGSSSMHHRASSPIFGGDSVGVIELKGVILDSKKVIKQLEHFEDESDIRAVVLRLDSPGGAVAPSQEIYEAVRRFKKPIIASMGSLAASGAYYIACGTRKIFANPGTLTGSVGVIMEFANLEKLYDWARIRRYVIKTGKFKDTGSEYREMTAEEKQLMQTMVDDVLTQFKMAIETGRKLTEEQVNRYADGRIMSGTQAKAIHFVDELGTLKDAVDDAARMANIKGKPNVVYPEKGRKWWMDLLVDDNHDDSESSEAPSSARSILGDVIVRLTGSTVDRFTGFTPGLYWLWTGAR